MTRAHAPAERHQRDSRCNPAGQQRVERSEEHARGTQEPSHSAHRLHITGTELPGETERQEDGQPRKHTGRADNGTLRACSYNTQSYCRDGGCNGEAVRDSPRAQVHDGYCAHESEQINSPYA